jgi:hypothetical protein
MAVTAHRAATWGCVGTGGGGGTGAIVSCAGAFPPNVVVQTLEGQAGLFLSVGYPCSGTTYDAMNGDPNPAGPVVLSGCFPPAPVVVMLDDDVISDVALCIGDTIFIDAGDHRRQLPVAGRHHRYLLGGDRRRTCLGYKTGLVATW